MEKTVFLNKEAVMPSYKLDNLNQFLCRDDEIKSYLFRLRGLLDTMCTELVVQGWAGTGVTTISNLCLEAVKERADIEDINLCIIHVDCNKYRTETAIYKYIIASLPEVIPKRKITNSRPYYLDYIEEFLDNYEGKLLIVFDNAEQMKNLNALEMFVRMGELKYTLDELKARGKREIRPHIICTTHKINFAFDGNPSFNSRFNAFRITMHSYDRNELNIILTTRAKMAFKPDTVPEEVIALLAKELYNCERNINTGLDFLLQAGEVADKLGEKQITVDIMKNLICKRYYEETTEDSKLDNF